MNDRRSQAEALALAGQKAIRAANAKVRDEKILRAHRMGQSVNQICQSVRCGHRVVMAALDAAGVMPNRGAR